MSHLLQLSPPSLPPILILRSVPAILYLIDNLIKDQALHVFSKLPIKLYAIKYQPLIRKLV